MSAVDTRNISRDSLFLMANLHMEADGMTYRVKVRNLSSGGMMAEDGPPVVRGAKLAIDLKNIGLVEGVVAWVQEDRFGIAFTREIDPKLARSRVEAKGEDSAPRYTRTTMYDPNDPNRDIGNLRNL